jgi:hypothetical protein
MQKITLDPALRARLNDLKSEVEVCDESGQTVGVCDESGQTVGYFLPAEWHLKLLYAWAKAEVTEEELEQARRETGGSSLDEIMARLQRL